MSLLGFGMSIMLASKNEFGSVLSLYISWKSLRSVSVSSSLKVWKKFSHESIKFQAVFVGKLFIIYSISLHVTGQFRW
jgi:hypothetical protein